VRVVNPDGEQLGIMPVAKALEISAKLGLDLVEVAPNSAPPVCRIMDYGQYKYLQSKKVQVSHKKKSTVQVKEIKLRPNTEDHDLDYKVKKAQKFLQEGNKTKVSMIFKGRELSHVDLGIRTMDKVKKMIGDTGTIEKEPKLEGRMMVMIFAPAKGK
jgi:translation initiation factor IF-3